MAGQREVLEVGSGIRQTTGWLPLLALVTSACAAEVRHVMETDPPGHGVEPSKQTAIYSGTLSPGDLSEPLKNWASKLLAPQETEIRKMLGRLAREYPIHLEAATDESFRKVERDFEKLNFQRLSAAVQNIAEISQSGGQSGSLDFSRSCRTLAEMKEMIETIGQNLEIALFSYQALANYYHSRNDAQGRERLSRKLAGIWRIEKRLMSGIAESDLQNLPAGVCAEFSGTRVWL